MPAEIRIVHARAGRSSVRQADELARRQFASVSRGQLLELGCTRSQISHWIQIGRLHPRYPGAYAWGRADLGTEGELASGLLYAGNGSALTGLSGLWWLGYLRRRPDLVHIDASGHTTSIQDLRIHHPAGIERSMVHGLPVAALARCLLLASTDLSRNSLRLVLARADYDKNLSLASLQAAISRAPRGARSLRAAMDAHLPQLARCTNGFERRFVLLCESFGLEIPDPSMRIGRYRPDMLWRKHLLIVELDGEDAHSSPAQLRSDATRQAYLESLGYTVLRFSWWELEFEPEKVAAEVSAYLSSS